MNNFNEKTKEWVLNTWQRYEPEWFVTLLWSDLPTSPVVSSGHTKHFRNVFLRKSCNVNSCKKIPDLNKRPGITAFQERTEINGKVVFHTHLHIYNSRGRWQSADDLLSFIRRNVGTHVEKLLKSESLFNKGVTVKNWSEKQHQNYNFKELRRNRHPSLDRYNQDKDMLLDVESSDLLPLNTHELNPRHQRHQSLSKTTDWSLRHPAQLKQRLKCTFA